MTTDRDSLISMGFEPTRVDWALRATSHRGLQPAMDHLLEHDGEPIPDPSSGTLSSTSTGAGTDGAPPIRIGDDDEDDDDVEALRRLGVAGTSDAGAAGEVEAKSIRCSECGKVFKNTALANYHAEKSGHDQFEESTEEIKPLTEEEKKQRLAELRQKMAEKRAQKDQEEAKEQKATESIRKKAGKDMNKIKEDMKLKQALKDAEQKRKDKLEDAKAKNAVRAQIEADKRARAEKAAREKALRQGNPIPDASTSTSPSTLSPTSPTTAASGLAGKDYKETRLQIRLANGGQPYTTTLPSDSTLRQVAEFLAGQSSSVDVDTVTFTQQFPRKTFEHSDFSSTLRELGLTPSAVLLAS